MSISELLIELISQAKKQYSDWDIWIEVDATNRANLADTLVIFQKNNFYTAISTYNLNADHIRIVFAYCLDQMRQHDEAHR